MWWCTDDVECYVKLGRGMWNWVRSRSRMWWNNAIMQDAMQLNCVKCGGCGSEMWPIYSVI